MRSGNRNWHTDILRFILISTVLYSGLIALNHFYNWDAVYADYSRKLCNVILKNDSYTGTAKFIESSSPAFDTTIEVKRFNHPHRFQSEWSFGDTGLKSILFLLALVFAVRLPAKRLLFYSALGVLLILGSNYFMTATAVKWTFLQANEHLGITNNGLGTDLINVSYKYILSNAYFSFIIPALIWLGMIFIFNDWRRLIPNIEFRDAFGNSPLRVVDLRD